SGGCREEHVKTCAFRHVAEHLVGDRVGGVARNESSADAAESLSDTREKQSQVVVNLGLSADSRARIACRILLANGDCGRNAVNLVDVRFVHALEKLARISGQRFDVAALSLGVDRVKSE